MKCSVLGALLLSFVFTSPAFARFNAEYDDAPTAENCGPVDPSKPCYFGSSGPYAACTARGTQRCRTCAQLRLNSAYVCVLVVDSAYCNCSDVKQPDGTTRCLASGACTFVYN